MLARATGASCPTCDQRPRKAGEDHDDAEPRQEDRPQLGDVVPQVLLGEEEVGLGVLARGHTSAGHEVARVRGLRSLVGELAVADELLQIRRNLFLAQRKARGVARGVDDEHGLEASAALVCLEQRLGPVRRQDLGSEHEIEARLLERAVPRVVQARLADDEERAGGERRGRDPGGQRERERQPPSQASAVHSRLTVVHGFSKR